MRRKAHVFYCRLHSHPSREQRLQILLNTHFPFGTRLRSVCVVRKEGLLLCGFWHPVNLLHLTTREYLHLGYIYARLCFDNKILTSGVSRGTTAAPVMLAEERACVSTQLSSGERLLPQEGGVLYPYTQLTSLRAPVDHVVAPRFYVWVDPRAWAICRYQNAPARILKPTKLDRSCQLGVAALLSTGLGLGCVGIG